MIPLPTLPTDNLYKFMTLAGLVLTVVAIVVPKVEVNSKIAQVEKEARELCDSTSEAAAKLSTLITDEARHSQDAKRTDAEVAAERLRMEVAFTTFKMQTSLKEQIAKHSIEQLSNEMPKVLLAWIWLRWIGIVLAWCGFQLWWYKIQRYQDKILFLEYEKLKRECETHTNAK